MFMQKEIKTSSSRGKVKKRDEKSAKEKEGNNGKKRVFGIITGLAAGLANGIFGGGGGMVVVPMLIDLMKKEPKTAHATAILIILPMSVLSGLFYAAFGTFDFRVGIPVVIGVAAGGTLGALLLNKLSSKWIVAVFCAVMAAAGVKMLFF